MIAVHDDLAFESARQFQAVEKHTARVAVAWIPVSFAYVFLAVARIFGLPIGGRPRPNSIQCTSISRTSLSRSRGSPHRGSSSIIAASPRAHGHGRIARQLRAVDSGGFRERLVRDERQI
jgi:hypothetical protein